MNSRVEPARRAASRPLDRALQRANHRGAHRDDPAALAPRAVHGLGGGSSGTW